MYHWNVLALPCVLLLLCGATLQPPMNLRFLERETSVVYAAPDGTPDGNGTSDNPWDIQTALAHPSTLKPGTILYLRGGQYDNVNIPGESTRSLLTGTAEAPIIVRSAPGEWAVLNFEGGPFGGGIILDGAWTTYRDFEITSFAFDRISSLSGSHPTDIPRNGFLARGDHLKLINLVIHDLVGTAVGAYPPEQNIEFYGNIIYYNGFQSPDRAHGHGIYIQNRTGMKLVAENIVFNQYHSGLHLFGTNAFVQKITLKGNIVFNNGAVSRGGNLANNIILSANQHPTDNITVVDNYTYHHRVQGQNQLGHIAGSGLVARDNYFIGGLFAVRVRRWSALNFTGNTVWSEVFAVELIWPGVGQPTVYTWDENFYTRGGRAAQYRLVGSALQSLTFPAWQAAAGLDARSTEQVTDTERPTGAAIFVRPNRYEAGRANIVVYNWEEQDTIEVEVGQVLVPGMAYEVRDVQNYFGPPVATGVYDGQPLTLPMTGLEVTPPHGNAPTHPAHTGPVFGAFVLRTP